MLAPVSRPLAALSAEAPDQTRQQKTRRDSVAVALFSPVIVPRQSKNPKHCHRYTSLHSFYAVELAEPQRPSAVEPYPAVARIIASRHQLIFIGVSIALANARLPFPQ